MAFSLPSKVTHIPCLWQICVCMCSYLGRNEDLWTFAKPTGYIASIENFIEKEEECDKIRFIGDNKEMDETHIWGWGEHHDQHWVLVRNWSGNLSSQLKLQRSN